MIRLKYYIFKEKAILDTQKNINSFFNKSYPQNKSQQISKSKIKYLYRTAFEK